MRPYLIAIAGPSGSGKTELARYLAGTLDAPILSLDSYYRDLPHLSYEARCRTNFDHPDSLDRELLAAQISALVEGAEIQVPVYDFTRHQRAADVHLLQADRFVIIEGLFALYFEEVRRLAGTCVYVDVPDEICLARRLERDIRERGRSVESVIEQYAATVRPMAEQYVFPARHFADVVASGLHPVRISAQAVLAHIQQGHAAGV